MKLSKRINHGKKLGLADRANKNLVDARNAGDAYLGLLVKARDENDTKMMHLFFER